MQQECDSSVFKQTSPCSRFSITWQDGYARTHFGCLKDGRWVKLTKAGDDGFDDTVGCALVNSIEYAVGQILAHVQNSAR